ncbi:MAG: TonB-dependent receptor [Methylibium sp.]|uniref:TonB-dependent receptor n=1 Tax=Methylibium sp. TaxID=2067992 RepID=UPI0017994E88|nr:TonB-dependent receptor [Methylibium sp.]MBA2721779.1 TonB-dependent receptor [Methylibium sp.]MBA3590169.1 TonB-dependent receptor [Methylibium sp.]
MPTFLRNTGGAVLRPASPFTLNALNAGCLCALAAALPALAQSTPPAALPPVVITGNPLGSDSLATPASVLTGPGLVLRRGSSLGETLSGLPGVSSSYFGPNANRPVIRGQDGERIRVLGNGGATLDASALSFDHAVPIEPLVVERLEVLRGPAALLYGGSAIGGVVNAIDNRIPKSALQGHAGALELRGGGAARARSAGALIEAGNGASGPGGRGFVLHADAFKRRTEDLRVPDFDRPVEGGGSERRDRIVNSASDAEGGALGGSMVWGQGYLGASVDTYRNDYGIVAEEDVLIRMQRDKFALAGEWRELGGAIRTVRARLQSTDYEHEEVEGTGEVGTTFSNKGEDGRIELEHAPLGGLKGVFGLQGERAKFEALGEEAFVPNTETRQWALFVHEELALAGASRLSFGARVERSRIESSGDADPSEPKFGDAQDRRFTATSAALGGVWDLAASWGSGWQATGNLAYTERAPASYELYANGVHLATSAFERGNADLDLERGGNLDVALEWKSGAHRLRAGAFVSRFSNYIALLRSSEADFVSDEGDSFPVYAFEGVKARLQGIELEGAWRAIDAEGSLDLEAQLDALRADNRSTGEPLPRIAPLRLRLGAAYSLAGWTLRGDVVRAQRQSRVPADDERTPAYTLLNLAVSKRLTVGMSDALLFVRLDNATDELAFNAGSIATVRELAPLPGRSLSAGLRVSF